MEHVILESNMKPDMQAHREFLKANVWEQWPRLERDQALGLPPPPVQKPYAPDSRRVALTPPGELSLEIGNAPLRDLIDRRRSHRRYEDLPLSKEELSFLLWATQGVREISEYCDGRITMRTVPSAGSRHPFETYLYLRRTEGIDPGLYRYLALEHELVAQDSPADFEPRLVEACHEQEFVAEAAAVFFWTAIPYRTEWRYSIISPKVIALDAGHVCQNLYLAAEAIGAGTCAIGAYNQRQTDALIGVDGEEEFTVYLAPVGRIAAV